ncbi:MAG: hypothetical protein R3B72_28430 [Polyangiaceae bacterium]
MSLTRRALAGTLLLAACNQGPELGVGAPQHLTVDTGYHTIQSDADRPYSAIAVDGEARRAYLGRGIRGIDVVDLGSMQVVDQITDLPGDDWRLDIQGIDVEGGELIVWGQRDDRPPVDASDLFESPPWEASFVVMGLSEDGSEALWSVELDLRDAVLEDSAFVQLPNVDAQVSGDTITVSFSHINQPDRLFRFDRPAFQASYDMLDADIPGVLDYSTVDYAKGIWPRESGEGLLVAAASRVWQVTSDEATPFSEDVSYAVDVREQDGLVYVADHDTGLRVFDAATATPIATLEVDDYIEDIDLADGYVFLAGREGIFVAEQIWSAGDLPAPEPPPVDDDPVDDPGCSWGWGGWGGLFWGCW